MVPVGHPAEPPFHFAVVVTASKLQRCNVAGVKFHKIHDKLIWCAQFDYSTDNRVVWDGIEGL
jgi:hypothetical protein